MVVLRKKPAAIPQKQLDQEKENNMRLQHRISYLEEQVKELQCTKQDHDVITQQQQQLMQMQDSQLHGHVTSISISSPPSTPPDKPLIFQRGNYITTLVGGKPIELMGEESPEVQHKRHNALTKSKSAAHITKTLIRENSNHDINVMVSNKSLSASRISVNSDSNFMSLNQHSHKREKERHRERERDQRERYERSHSKMQMHARSVEQLNHVNG